MVGLQIKRRSLLLLLSLFMMSLCGTRTSLWTRTSSLPSSILWTNAFLREVWGWESSIFHVHFVAGSTNGEHTANDQRETCSRTCNNHVAAAWNWYAKELYNTTNNSNSNCSSSRRRCNNTIGDKVIMTCHKRNNIQHVFFCCSIQVGVNGLFFGICSRCWFSEIFRCCP